MTRSSPEGSSAAPTSQQADTCVFCAIAAGRAPASVVHEDQDALCFMTLRPTRPGECLVIPRTHVDHFIDLPPRLLAHVVDVARRVGRAIQTEFQPLRVGMIVHGFGVPHAHFILVPQHDPDDITSGRFAVVEDGEVRFRHGVLPKTPRSELDDQAERLRSGLEGSTRGPG